MTTILVTNDDGVQAPGLLTLFKTLQQIGAPVIIAPAHDNSAVSHALTMNRPLLVKQHDDRTYSIDGTPTDCVTLGVNRILTEKPALVVSGINPGGNLGDDIGYSGTVSAAIEGTMMGIPSMAVSLASSGTPFLFETAAAIAAKVARLILERGLPRDTLLNINVPNLPAADIAGIRFTRQGRRKYDDAIKDTFDPWGRKHYWIGGGTPVWDNGIDTDSEAVAASFISITPIHLDLTNYEALDFFRKEWEIENR